MYLCVWVGEAKHTLNHKANYKSNYCINQTVYQIIYFLYSIIIQLEWIILLLQQN